MQPPGAGSVLRGDAPGAKGCWATTKSGAPCAAPRRKDSEYCSARENLLDRFETDEHARPLVHESRNAATRALTSAPTGSAPPCGSRAGRLSRRRARRRIVSHGGSPPTVRGELGRCGLAGSSWHNRDSSEDFGCGGRVVVCQDGGRGAGAFEPDDAGSGLP
jgi:hypothetical protein